MALKNKYGVNICIIALVFLPSVLLQDPAIHVYYKGVTQGELRTILSDKKKGGEQYYYVGLTQESGTELESLCHRSQQKKKGSTGCDGKSQHHTDKDAEKNGLRLAEVYYLSHFSQIQNVYALEKELIGDDWHPAKTLTRNKKPGQDLEDRGIVYLRIYNKIQPKIQAPSRSRGRHAFRELYSDFGLEEQTEIHRDGEETQR